MNDRDRLRELERRVDDVERQLVRMDTAPPNVVEEWLEHAERLALVLLMERLQVLMPGFAATALREEFLELEVRMLDEAFKSVSPDAEPVRAFIEARVRELAEELFPTPVGQVEAT